MANLTLTPGQIALVRAQGSKAWDVDGKEYIDFLSMYSVTNFGHSHPKIVAAATKAASECAVVNMVRNPPDPRSPFDPQPF